MLGDNKYLDGPKIRALAETVYFQGADGLMLYNFYPCAERFRKFYPHLRSWTDPLKVPGMSRQYFYCRRLSRKKQLVVRQEGVPPKELWEGYAT